MEQILDPASYFNKVSLPLVRAFYSCQAWTTENTNYNVSITIGCIYTVMGTCNWLWIKSPDSSFCRMGLTGTHQNLVGFTIFKRGESRDSPFQNPSENREPYICSNLQFHVQNTNAFLYALLWRILYSSKFYC